MSIHPETNTPFVVCCMLYIHS